ncbi:MAG: WecB/TagA/CpsF family glycosyltransferase [Burkholderiales bacterium]|nr:WecB/TagA/CpsF family glycosyltransferase [Burkholderiales bacterium]
MCEDRLTAPLLGSLIDVIHEDKALGRILSWARRRESRYVCLCNVHSLVTAGQDAEFALAVNASDMATPDGAPVAWMLRRLGFSGQKRIAGADLMWAVCAAAAGEVGRSLRVIASSGVDARLAANNGGNLIRRDPAGPAITNVESVEYLVPSIYLYGSSEETLTILRRQLIASFPELKIAGAYSPPFRSLTQVEDAAVIAAINNSGAGVVWVSLGCPKQEKWMAAHRGRINAVMVGVGAAFEFHAGTIKRAPLWMQRAGLEWLHRFVSEPRRLWKRYLVTNILFVLRACRQLILGKK